MNAYYLTDKEAQLVRLCLVMDRKLMTPGQQEMVDNIIRRMNICDKTNQRLAELYDQYWNEMEEDYDD